MIAQTLGLLLLGGVASGLAIAIYIWTIVREVLHPPRGGMAFALARRLPTAPQELGLATRSFQVACEGGFSMPVWEVSRDPGAVDGTATTTPRPRIVLLHGWGRSRIDSLGRLEPFLIDDAAVYVVDLRGHGDAAGQSAAPTTLGTREPGDIDRLIATLPPGPVILAGHSMGSTIAVAVAADGFERVRIRGVIAIAPYDTVESPIGCRLASRELPRGLFVRAAMALLRLRGVEARSTVDAAGRLAVPLLVIHGSNDRVSPLEEAKAIAAAASTAGCEYVELPEAEHADHQHRHPDRLETAIRGFLRRVLA